MNLREFIKQETRNPVHNVKVALIFLAMLIYLVNGTIVDYFYPEGGTRFWDFMFASWCLIFALVAQAVALSRSKVVRFIASQCISWFLFDAFMFVFPHNSIVVEQRSVSDYLIIIAVFILGVNHYNANTRLFNIITKWQKIRK